MNQFGHLKLGFTKYIGKEKEYIGKALPSYHANYFETDWLRDNRAQ